MQAFLETIINNLRTGTCLLLSSPPPSPPLSLSSVIYRRDWLSAWPLGPDAFVWQVLCLLTHALTHPLIPSHLISLISFISLISLTPLTGAVTHQIQFFS